MLKYFISLSILTTVFCQEYFVDNIVDIQEPYQIRSLPYPYQDDRRIGNVRTKPIKNAIIDNGYKQTQRIVNLVEKQEAKTSLSGLSTSTISTVIAKFLGAAKTALTLLVHNTPALIFGAVVMVLFCKITSVCTKINGIKSFSEAQKEFIAFVTPERLDIATEFVQDAIRRYRSIQAS